MKQTLIPLLTGLAALTLSICGHAACWQPVPAESTITFDASQAGAPMQGTFTRYQGRICIGKQAADNHITIRIDLASVNTQLPELDTALRGVDFFNVARWPEGRFESQSLQALGQNRYQVTGQLTLRDVTRRVTVPFSLMPTTKGEMQLEGHFSIQRLDYHIGLGQWADTRWVGNQVDIKFSVRLAPVHSAS